MFQPSNSKKSLYQILDLSPKASTEEIKESYARAKSTYTDENPALYGMVSGEDREKTLHDIEEAFRILGNNDLKMEYDQKMGYLTKISEPHIQMPENNKRTDNSAVPDQNFEQQSIKKLIETNKYQLSFDLNEELEKKIREATTFDGDFLKEIREYKKVSIEKMAEMTRISKTNLKNIEAENTSPLPALVYVRGFVYQYAKCLKLNPELVASSYIHQLKKKETAN